MNLRKTEAKWAYILLIPALIGLVVFAIVPIVASFIFSTLDWFGFREPVFIGLENYKALMSDELFFQSLFNTVRMSIIIVPTSILIASVVAAMLNQNIKGISIYRTLYYLPVVTMPAAIAVVFKNLFSKDFGWINGFIGLFGVDPVSWLGNPDYSWIVICIVTIWTMIGFQILILLAAMQNVPPSLYEACEIDGAGTFRKFFSVTLPLVSPTLFFLLITGFVGVFKLFDIIFLLIGTGGTGIDSTRTLIFYFYDVAFVNSDKGYGSAIIVIVFIILTIVSVFNFKMQKKWVTYDR